MTRQDVRGLLELAAAIPIHTRTEVFPLAAANDALAALAPLLPRGPLRNGLAHLRAPDAATLAEREEDREDEQWVTNDL